MSQDVGDIWGFLQHIRWQKLLSSATGFYYFRYIGWAKEYLGHVHMLLHKGHALRDPSSPP